MRPGHRIAQYEILEKLGSGGMGVVYRAHDHRLDRPVALKFLPAAWSEDASAKARFLREARAASGLDHPNIYTIYEIGEAEDGGLFIVTPLYDGQTLKYRLADGPPPIDDVRSIIRQLLEALATAHRAGITHRDVKPANVMVTDSGTVKLLDFGLAKLSADVHFTREGTTLGTAAYMSPEQAMGRPVDHRTDLWSVGVILYEMLAGRRPFEGEYDQAVIYSVLNQDPVPVETLRPDAPGELVTVVHRLLQKAPDARFESAEAVLATLDAGVSEPAPLRAGGTLRRWVAAAVLIAAAGIAGLLWLGRPAGEQSERRAVHADENRSSIAVMPFSNLNGDPQTDFLRYALADQIIGALSYVRELLVRPSSSIRPFVDKTYSTRSAGEELSVDYLLNGTYLRQADEMRLTIELVDVSSDEIIWREPLQLKYENAFQVQDAVSEKVLHRLEVEFSDAERRRMTHDVPKDPLAYDYYLQAISYPQTKDGNRRAVETLQRALAVDSTFAPAWNELGFRWQRIGQYALGGEDVIERAERAFLKSLDLNPSLLGALGNLSTLSTDTGRTLEGIRLADRMLEINPSSALGHFARGYALRYAGQTDESVQEMYAAIRLDSTDTRFRSAGISFVVAGDLDAAERAFRIDRGSLYTDAWLGEVMVRRGETDAGLRILHEVARRDSNGLLGLWSQGLVSALEGRYEEGLAAARQWERSGIVDVEAQYYLAALYCINHDADACIRALKRAVMGGYFNIDNLVNDRFVATAREDSRFEAILRLAREKQAAFKRAYETVDDGRSEERGHR